MRIFKFMILFLAVICSGCGVSSADKLYDGFRNPPESARPLARWCWDAGSPTEKEILNRIDAFKKEGFGGVEIYPIENTDARMLKFAADAAKKRGLLVDLALGSILAAPNLQPGERSQIITLGKETVSGPTTYETTLSELVNFPDETRAVARETKRRLMFLRLIPQGLKSFQPGIRPTDKINPYGPVTFDIPDGNHIFYVGVLHEIAARPPGYTSDVPVLDVLNKQAVEKYFKNITAKLSSAFGSKLGDSIHAISCENIDLFGANWTGDFAQQFLNRRKYDVLPYLPVVLDDTLPKERTRFYDTARRIRYDFCLTFAELFNENFVQTFHNWCRDNGAESRLSVTDVNTLLVLKAVADANAVFSDMPIGDDPIFAGGNARLSYLFQNSTRRSQIAVLLPTVDIWSDCGLYRARCEDYIWYLVPLRQALNHNGYATDYISEQVLSRATYDDGKLHFGSQTWDAVIVPDVCSIEFAPAKTLRFFAKAGGKIAFISGYPNTSPGFKDLLQRTIPIQITMEHIEKEYQDRALVILPPQKDKDNLTTWAAEIPAKLGILPTVKISPASDNLLFVHYVADNRDIFFFTNTNSTEEVSFNAKFNTAGKTSVAWDIETGERGIFPYGDKKNELDIHLEPLKSLLLVFEPDSKDRP
ncbi:MAG: glycosyl hydrolase [Planctomycetota bacterium]